MLRCVFSVRFGLFQQQRVILRSKGAIMNGEGVRKEFLGFFSELFKNNATKTQLGKIFRLFPSYFSTYNVESMLRHQLMDDYICHFNKRGHSSISNPELRALLRAAGVVSWKQRRMLECYIDYIKNTEDLAENYCLMETFDIRNPQNWFSKACSTPRTFVYHHGPTNSGKTYSAINELRSLKEDQKGIYIAPLRLLAWEAQKKLGKCDLITGQEKDYQNSNLTSCTIEACNMKEEYEVAIVDEIQMIDNPERGWGWTSVILGLRAKRIHLCGDQRALKLISRLVTIANGTLQEKKYSRMSKLHLIQNKFKMGKLKPGDCIIDFSVAKLYEHRDQINKRPDKQSAKESAAIVYGKLPPRCRKQQAQLFNSGVLPYLVASDAIGMGLNLMISRVIFINLFKMRGKMLQDHEIRQIAGRAGRGMDHGYVICSDSSIHERVKRALYNVNITYEQNQSDDTDDNCAQATEQQREPSCPTEARQYNEVLQRPISLDQMKITKAALFYPESIIKRLKLRIEELTKQQLKLSDAISLIGSLSQENQQLYFVQNPQGMLSLCSKLEGLKLPLFIQFKFAATPINQKAQGSITDIVVAYAHEFKDTGQVSLPAELYQDYQSDFSSCHSPKHIRKLEDYFAQLESYTWLWNHFELNFPHIVEANRIKETICDRINDLLGQHISDCQEKRI